VTVGEGDLVTFPQGMDCTWHIHTDIRKHYRFG
ncbi:MAG: cupin domain-containing protein, partial [Pseudomonadota bacterium]